MANLFATSAWMLGIGVAFGILIYIGDRRWRKTQPPHVRTTIWQVPPDYVPPDTPGANTLHATISARGGGGSQTTIYAPEDQKAQVCLARDTSDSGQGSGSRPGRGSQYDPLHSALTESGYEPVSEFVERARRHEGEQ